MFDLFLSGRLRQVLVYPHGYDLQHRKLDGTKLYYNDETVSDSQTCCQIVNYFEK